VGVGADADAVNERGADPVSRRGPDPVGERLRALPSVERLARQLVEEATASPRGDEGAGRADAAGAALSPLATAVARETVERRREELLAGADGEADLLERARAALAAARRPSLRPVINATGVIVHTNLGRAPLAQAALEQVQRVGRSYSNLELDLAGGERGSRQDHVARLLCELTGAQAALVVNNCAAATLLAAASMAGPGRAIVVSRGQLIEIGGSFRLPDVIALSGARLVEVGTANRTRAADYACAIADPEHAPVGAILRVHPSNFRALGFVEEASIEELCELGVPVIDDAGSGVLVEGAGSGALVGGVPELADEPAVPRSVRAGAALVCFSGDKLLGGPQAGIVVGRREAVGAARRHPLARAVRIDKLSLAALEATLRLYREPERARRELPVLAMLDMPAQQLAERARRLADELRGGGVPVEVVEAAARVGGGALPLVELRGPVVALDGGAKALAGALRAGDPPVVGRISDDRLLLDPRTMREDEIEPAARAVAAATGG
jgi:L-seryl-tRNA(Ser) seleniumtransferase